MSTNTKKALLQEPLETSETEEMIKTVAPTVAVTDIAEYRPHEEQIVRLETTYAKLVVDCSTSEGLANAKEVRVDIRDVRYALDKTTKTALIPYQQKVKDAQARVNQVKEFGETLRARVLVLEEPIDDTIKAEEKRVADAKAEKDRLEQERIDAIRAKINRFSSVAAAYASRSAADVASILLGVKESVILPEEYGEFEADGTIARDNAIEQLEALHKAAVDREEAAAKLLAQQQELDELRERTRRQDEEAAEQRRIQAKKDQDELDRKTKEQSLQQQKLDDQARKLREQEDQNRKDQEELARLRAQASAPAPAPVAAAAPSMVEEKAEPAPTVVQAIAVEAFSADTSTPPADDIVEIVALGFDVDLDTARAWLRATSF